LAPESLSEFSVPLLPHTQAEPTGTIDTRKWQKLRR
jgi:hypothetical protein